MVFNGMTAQCVRVFGNNITSYLQFLGREEVEGEGEPQMLLIFFNFPYEEIATALRTFKDTDFFSVHVTEEWQSFCIILTMYFTYFFLKWRAFTAFFCMGLIRISLSLAIFNFLVRPDALFPITV